jgi:hypothetical protein
MPDKRNGLLMVLMQPPAALEEEFTAWYDTEHVPERAALPGFQTAIRYVALEGYPRYMAIYDLDHVSVLDSAEYLAISGPNFSPWTKRVTSRVQAIRIVGEQIFPGDAVTARSLRMMLMRLRSAEGVDEGMTVKNVRKVFESRPETSSVRVFRSTEGDKVDYFCLIGMTQPLVGAIELSGLGELSPKVDLVNLYAPYAIGG